jgi:hypothetical protein
MDGPHRRVRQVVEGRRNAVRPGWSVSSGRSIVCAIDPCRSRRRALLDSESRKKPSRPIGRGRYQDTLFPGNWINFGRSPNVQTETPVETLSPGSPGICSAENCSCDLWRFCANEDPEGSACCSGPRTTDPRRRATEEVPQRRCSSAKGTDDQPYGTDDQPSRRLAPPFSRSQADLVRIGAATTVRNVSRPRIWIRSGRSCRMPAIRSRLPERQLHIEVPR